MRETRKLRQRGSWPRGKQSRVAVIRLDRAVRTTPAPAGVRAETTPRSSLFLSAVTLDEQLERIGQLAQFVTRRGRARLAGVLAAEPQPRARASTSALSFAAAALWLAVGDDGRPLEDRERFATRPRSPRSARSRRRRRRAATSRSSGPQLVALRDRRSAGDRRGGGGRAGAAEGRSTGRRDRVAGPLDADRVATRRVELALGDVGRARPFAEAMKTALAAVEALTQEIERGYKLPLAA